VESIVRWLGDESFGVNLGFVIYFDDGIITDPDVRPEKLGRIRGVSIGAEFGRKELGECGWGVDQKMPECDGIIGSKGT